MQNSYIKLNAKRGLVKNYFICFSYAILPYVTIVLLCTLNYYLYIFLESMSLNSLPFISSYEIYVKATLLTIGMFVSFGVYKFTQLLSHVFFFCKNMNVKRLKITFSKYATFVMVSILKLFLGVAWGAFYLFPSAIMGGTLYYSISTGEYSFNVNLTLLVSSVLLLLIGLGFLYATLKRYSMCSYVIFTEKKTEAISVIEKSINLMEGNLIKYTAFSMSFLGWILSCILIIPAFYVLPYIEMARYSYFKVITKSQAREQTAEKPIIFYIKKKA